MNLLIEKAPDYIVIRGEKININTSFETWVDFLISAKKNDISRVKRALLKILCTIPKCNISEIITECVKWSFNTSSDKQSIETSESKNTAVPFDFDVDGNIIYCELWEYFPHLMERGISYHEGVELIKILMHNENTMLWHRAFARTGNFSEMSKEQKKYWQKQRAIWVIPDAAKQDDIDNIMSGAF